MKKARLFSFFLTLALLLTTLPVSAAPILIFPAPQRDPAAGWLIQPMKSESEFPDVKDSWCETAVDTVCRTGLMQGKTAERFDATSPLTYAQITVITARLHHLLNGGDGILPKAAEGEEWYHPALNYLLSVERTGTMADGLLNNMSQWGNDQVLPNQPCPRESFVMMLDAVLPEGFYEKTLLNPAACAPDMPDHDVISAFYQSGILIGSDEYGTFFPYESLSRGAAAAILARIIDPVQRQQVTLRQLDLCRDVLDVAPDTVLVTVNGEEITAEIFAYLCVNSGTLYQVDQNPFYHDMVMVYLKDLAARELIAEDLTREEVVSLLPFSPEEEQTVLEKATAKAGFAGISEEGWQRIVRKEMISNYVMIHYLLTYGEQSPREGENGYTMLARATKVAEEKLSIETTDALEALDWNAIFHRALKTPCASTYQLSIW